MIILIIIAIIYLIVALSVMIGAVSASSTLVTTMYSAIGLGIPTAMAGAGLALVGLAGIMVGSILDPQTTRETLGRAAEGISAVVESAGTILGSVGSAVGKVVSSTLSPLLLPLGLGAVAYFLLKGKNAPDSTRTDGPAPAPVDQVGSDPGRVPASSGNDPRDD